MRRPLPLHRTRQQGAREAETVRRTLCPGAPVLAEPVAVEQRHIVDAFLFELTRVQRSVVRQRIVAGLVNIDAALAEPVAADLGIAVPAPLRRVHDTAVPDYVPSPSLSLFARPGATGIRTRRVALLVADGVDAATVRHLYAALLKEGAPPRIVGQRLGEATGVSGKPLDIEITVQAAPSVLYDAVIVAPGDASAATLVRDGRVLEFLREQYRHGKPMLVLGGRELAARRRGHSGRAAEWRSGSGPDRCACR